MTAHLLEHCAVLICSVPAQNDSLRTEPIKVYRFLHWVQFVCAPSESPIFRLDGERVNTVQSFVHRDVLPEEVLKKILAKIDESNLNLPPGYRLEVGGDADARNEVLTSLLSVAGIIGALMFVTIVLTFNSYQFRANRCDRGFPVCGAQCSCACFLRLSVRDHGCHRTYRIDRCIHQRRYNYHYRIAE